MLAMSLTNYARRPSVCAAGARLDFECVCERFVGVLMALDGQPVGESRCGACDGVRVAG